MKMDNENLRKVQLLQLKLVKFLKEICEDNDIKYLIVAGTLLGAVRHKGFIPWDDDLDVGMLRDDYEKFLKVCPLYLTDEICLQDWHSEKEFPGAYAKLRLKNTVYIERNSQYVNINKGIYIDIFPFDNTPNGRLSRFKQKLISGSYKKMLIAKSGSTPWSQIEKLKYLCYKLLKGWSSLFSFDFLHMKLDKCMMKYNSLQTEKITAFGGAYGYDKETIEKEWVRNTIQIEFENTMLPAPALYDKYLTYFYGEYMTPPPENKRYNRHMIIDVNFGDYENEVDVNV